MPLDDSMKEDFEKWEKIKGTVSVSHDGSETFYDPRTPEEIKAARDAPIPPPAPPPDMKARATKKKKQRNRPQSSIDDGKTPTQWVEQFAGDKTKAIKRNHADIIDLESQFHLIFRFFLEPLWDVIYELQARMEENPDRVRTPGVATGATPMPQRSTAPWQMSEKEATRPHVSLPTGLTLERVKCLYALRELNRRRGNRMGTARALGINVKTLYNMMVSWEKEFGSEVTEAVKACGLGGKKHGVAGVIPTDHKFDDGPKKKEADDE